MSFFHYSILVVFSVGLMVSCSGDQEQVQEAVEQEASEDSDNAALGDNEADLDAELEAIATAEDEEESAMLALVAGESETAEPEASLDSAAGPGALGDYWVFVPTARLYAEPKTNASVVATLAYGEKITAQNKENGWVHSGQGWVQVWKLTDRNKGFANKKNVLFITASDAVVHAEATSDAPAVGKMTRGERVVVSGRQGNWLQIGAGRFIEKNTAGPGRPAH